MAATSSLAGSVLLPLNLCCKRKSFGSAKTFVLHDVKPLNLGSYGRRKTICGCMAPNRDLRPADADEFSAATFNARDSSIVDVLSMVREPDEADVLIECRDVYKSFGEKHILRGASFKIRHGEAVGIIGPSGTGKSTILRIMAGLLDPDKMFQSAALFDLFNHSYENSNMPEDQISELVTQTLAAVGLKGVEDRLPSELSGGMKKRVALVHSIIFDTTKDEVEPEVLLYDEPTAGLDPIASTVVEDLKRSLHRKGEDNVGKPGKIASYVVVTHQRSTIKRAVDRLLFLSEGKVVWQGMTHEFSSSANSIVRQGTATFNWMLHLHC